MTKEDVTWYHLQHLCFFFHSCVLTIIWDVGCCCFFPNLWPHHKCFETLEKGMNRLVSKRTSWSVVGFCLFGFFFSLLHYGKHQYCIHVSAVCFSNVCSNRRSTSLLAFVALTAFKNKNVPERFAEDAERQICFCYWRTSVHVQTAVHRFCERAGVTGRHQSSLRVCDGKAKSTVLQDGTHTLSALNSVSFLYDLLSVLQCIW